MCSWKLKGSSPGQTHKAHLPVTAVGDVVIPIATLAQDSGSGSLRIFWRLLINIPSRAEQCPHSPLPPHTLLTSPITGFSLGVQGFLKRPSTNVLCLLLAFIHLT